MSENEEKVETQSEDLSEHETIEELDHHLELLIQVNNFLVLIIDNLEKVNTQLCKLVSNANNVSFVCDKHCKHIKE